eukprot:5825149-Alexandrium_andersonii.AAC.1
MALDTPQHHWPEMHAMICCGGCLAIGVRANACLGTLVCESLVAQLVDDNKTTLLLATSHCNDFYSQGDQKRSFAQGDMPTSQ